MKEMAFELYRYAQQITGLDVGIVIAILILLGLLILLILIFLAALLFKRSSD